MRRRLTMQMLSRVSFVSALKPNLEETAGDVAVFADATAPEMFSAIVVAFLFNMTARHLPFFLLLAKQPKLPILPTAAAV